MGIAVTDVVPFGIDEVFAWHERPGALQRLLPPWLPLRVQQEAPNLRDGRAVLRLPGGVTWVAQHGEYDPPHRFVDRLTSWPLPWRHLHTFEAVDDSSTRVGDEIDTPLPAALLGSALAYRHRQLADDLAVCSAAQPGGEAMTVAVTGASGLVGRNLCALLGVCGHRVIRLVRRPPSGPGQRRWNPGDPDSDLLAGVDVLVHLAGASIAGRFTDGHKNAIRDSRVEPTRSLAELAGTAGRGGGRLRAFVCASAIGYYGAHRGDEMLGEDADRGDGFLADVVADWEAATVPAAEAGVRTVRVRTGIVQSPKGGALRLQRPIFAAGLGGRLGDGRQWTSWIDLDDLSDIYLRAVTDDTLSGAVNAAAPEPVRNGDYARCLAATLRRPALLPVSDLGPRLLLGAEGADQVALAGQRVVPAALAAAGHRFRRPDLAACLRHQFGRFPATTAAGRASTSG